MYEFQLIYDFLFYGAVLIFLTGLSSGVLFMLVNNKKVKVTND